MSVEHLPWEEVPGPIYSARELKPRKKWVTVGSWILSVVLVVGGILTPYRVLIVFGVLYVLTLLMKKDTVVTRRGLEMFYQMRITTQYNFWGWDEIVSVVREDRNHPEVVALYFGQAAVFHQGGRPAHSGAGPGVQAPDCHPGRTQAAAEQFPVCT